jgi:hypothetical protein
MKTAKSSAADVANALLDDAQKAADSARGSYERQAKRRRWLAYALKGIALFGGLFVATVKVVDPTIPGVVIAAAVTLDQLMSNHRRMISDTAAANAIARTQRRVGNSYNDQVPLIVGKNNAGESKVAEEMLASLASQSAKALRDELDRIQTAVEQNDIEFLGSLNVDRFAQTSLPSVSTPAA